MNRNSTIVGIVLVFIGALLFMRNFDLIPSGTLVLCLGAFLLYLGYRRKQQPMMVVGGIITFIGAVSVIDDLNLFRINLSFEMFLILLGCVFLFFFFTRHVQGFIFPGMILPALGIYTLIMRTMSPAYMWPSFFVLLGLAFYFIYFLAYAGRSSWPLIPGSILIGLGVVFFLFSLQLFTFNIFADYGNYILPGVLVLAGVLMLCGVFFRGRGRR